MQAGIADPPLTSTGGMERVRDGRDCSLSGVQDMHAR